MLHKSWGCRWKVGSKLTFSLVEHKYERIWKQFDEKTFSWLEKDQRSRYVLILGKEKGSSTFHKGKEGQLFLPRKAWKPHWLTERCGGFARGGWTEKEKILLAEAWGLPYMTSALEGGPQKADERNKISWFVTVPRGPGRGSKKQIFLRTSYMEA